MSFSNLAEVYDYFNDLSLYENWLDFVLDQIGDNTIDYALDLGCGTGWFTQLLAPFVDQEIIGVDIDDKMLTIAKSETNNSPGIRFQQGNITRLEFSDASFVLLTSFFDVINFLEDESTVLLAFREAYRVLKNEGMFIFDMIMQPMLDEHYHNFEYFDTNEEASLLWESHVEGSTVYHHLVTFIKKDIDCYARHSDCLVEHVYDESTILSLLEKAGFSRDKIQIEYDVDQKEQENRIEKARIFITAQK